VTQLIVTQLITRLGKLPHTYWLEIGLSARCDNLAVVKSFDMINYTGIYTKHCIGWSKISN
jgi:hypothetical protein